MHGLFQKYSQVESLKRGRGTFEVVSLGSLKVDCFLHLYNDTMLCQLLCACIILSARVMGTQEQSTHTPYPVQMQLHSEPKLSDCRFLARFLHV